MLLNLEGQPINTYSTVFIGGPILSANTGAFFFCPGGGGGGGGGLLTWVHVHACMYQ